MSNAWFESMTKKLGSEEAVKQYMADLARSQKGSKKPNSGFASMTPERRSEISRAAARKRWANK